MKQTVLLFARASDLAGTHQVELSLPPEPCISDVRRVLVAQVPALQSLAGSLLIALNNKYAADKEKIPAGAEVACFPPVSGG